MLLAERSILIQICILLVINENYCQNYDYGTEYDYSSNEEESSHHPDYSKYYATDKSSPLITESDSGNAGFTSPIEFSSFFTPIELGATQKQEVINNPFVQQESQVNGFVDEKQSNLPQFLHESNFPKDYFEESQKQQQTKNEESYSTASIPSYITHHTPTEIGTTVEKPIKYTKPYKSKSNYAAVPKYTDYTVGKADSSLFQYPQAPGLYENLKAPTPTPYQKYSFQPVKNEDFKSKYLDSIISTVAPFNPTYSKLSSAAATPAYESQSTENVPSQLKQKNCKRVKKSIQYSDRKKRDTMDCYVCDDPSTKSKYTHCSYAEESEPIDHYESNSERYSTPAKESYNYRHKRYSGDEYSDPYEYIKSRSLSSYRKPAKKDYDEFVPYYNESPDKSFSEVQAEQLKTDPANCIKESKDGMTCTVCKDPKTGGNFEQCSYTSEPKEQKYAYVTEKKYDSANTPEESSESKPVKQTKEIDSELVAKEKFQKFQPKQEHEQNIARKLIDDEPYQIPKHFAESTKNQEKHQVRGLNPALYSNEDSSETESGESSAADNDDEIEQYKDHVDEYHFKLFPQHKEESKQEQVSVHNPADASRKDVEEVLAEFSKKDRSACKKAEKQGMTCYLCVDKKGIQHEECMYVSESKPQASHVAYHEVKQIKSPDNDKIHHHHPHHDEDNDYEPASSELKRKRFFKKVTTESPIALVEAASEDIDSKIKLTKKPLKKIIKRKIIKGPARRQDENEPTQKTPVEFLVGDEEGAFSAETRPVYSKKFGTKLPIYMIEKSEFEKEFDADAYNH